MQTDNEGKLVCQACFEGNHDDCKGKDCDCSCREDWEDEMEDE